MAQPSNAPIILRPMVESDRNLILQSWLRSHSGRWFGRALDHEDAMRGHERLIKALLLRTIVKIAAFSEDADFILGWACTSPAAVHYVWVRPKFHHQGIASELLKDYLDRSVIYTHPCTTEHVHAPKSWVYDPYFAIELAYTSPTQGASVRRHTEATDDGARKQA